MTTLVLDVTPYAHSSEAHELWFCSTRPRPSETSVQRTRAYTGLRTWTWKATPAVDRPDVDLVDREWSPLRTYAAHVTQILDAGWQRNPGRLIPHLYWRMIAAEQLSWIVAFLHPQEAAREIRKLVPGLLDDPRAGSGAWRAHLNAIVSTCPDAVTFATHQEISLLVAQRGY